MNVCAITMVYRDYWALSQWYRHYAKLVGVRNLFIIAHGHDAEISRLCPKASVITIPRASVANFDKDRSNFLNAFQNSLLHQFKWVIRTDVDELVCIDPALYQGIEDALTSQSASVVFGLGLNIVEVNSDLPLQIADVGLKQRRNAIFSGHYSKAFAIGRPENFLLHGVVMRPRRVDGFAYSMPQGVYLAHLKYANKVALDQSNRHRVEIASLPDQGLPGKAWRNATQEAADFYESFNNLPCVAWDDAKTDAYGKLSVEPKREKENGLVRAQKLRFSVRTTTPDWFQML